MREILFRGRYEVIDYKTRTVSFDWAEGCLDTTHCGVVIFSNPMARFAVDPETVGEYTGLKDKNGKRIFEGDIVNILGWGIGEIYFTEGRYGAKKPVGHPFYWIGFCKTDHSDFAAEVIGNIHDNPELLEGGEA
jgi:hypothetical protein